MILAKIRNTLCSAIAVVFIGDHRKTAEHKAERSKQKCDLLRAGISDAIENDAQAGDSCRQKHNSGHNLDHISPLPHFAWLGTLALSLSACAAPIVTASSSACASLLPQSWKQGVAPAPLPDGNTVGDWIAFGDAQTAKLDIANDRTVSAIGIIERCEARDAAAIKRASKGFFGRIFS